MKNQESFISENFALKDSIIQEDTINSLKDLPKRQQTYQEEEIKDEVNEKGIEEFLNELLESPTTKE